MESGNEPLKNKGKTQNTEKAKKPPVKRRMTKPPATVAANKARGIEPKEPPKPKRGRGRPQYEPTERDRSKVISAITTGVSQQVLCISLKIGIHTLRRHFKDELKQGYELSKAEMGTVAYEAAKKAENDSRFVGALAHYEKTRHGYSERSALDVTSGGDKVSQLPPIVVLPELPSTDAEPETK